MPRKQESSRQTISLYDIGCGSDIISVGMIGMKSWNFITITCLTANDADTMYISKNSSTSNEMYNVIVSETYTQKYANYL